MDILSCKLSSLMHFCLVGVLGLRSSLLGQEDINQTYKTDITIPGTSMSDISS